MCEYNTKAIQEIELNILDEIDRLCKEYGIIYFASGGTFLGAVRHKGFIPWDNDIDLGMFRDEYERFIQVAEEHLNGQFEIHTYRNNKSHHYYMAHVVDKRYSVKRLGSKDQRIENVWVDIFPYDALPNNPIRRCIHYSYLTFCRAMFHLAYFETVDVKRKDRSRIDKIAIGLCKYLSVVVHPDKIKWRERIDELLKRYSIKKSDYIVNFIGIKRRKEIFPQKFFADLIQYEFEGRTILGPKDYDRILSQLYGDYWSPPKDKNKGVHPIELVGDYAVHGNK